MASREGAAQGDGSCVRVMAFMAAFPPLPGIPTAPQTGIDPRQRRTREILGNLQEAIGLENKGAPVRGYHASAVNVGKLQATLERCLRRFSEPVIEARWGEIHVWVVDFLGVWVQRRKEIGVERHGAALHVRLKTQDDFGYYEYAFDVFPHRDADEGSAE